MDTRYPATVETQEDGTVFVQFVDLPDTFTEGQTREEALFNAAEVLSAMLAWRLDASQPVPAPSQKVRGAHYIAPDAKTQAARHRTNDPNTTIRWRKSFLLGYAAEETVPAP
jgi:antitoxin HicB